MSAHAALAETEIAEDTLGGRHLAQPIEGDLCPVREARRETGARRAIGGRQADAAAEGADLGLGQPDLGQRMTDAVLLRRAQARAVVAEIIEIDAIDDGADAESLRLRVADLVQAALAEIAAVDRIRGVAGNVELVGVDQVMAHAQRRRDLARHRLVLFRGGGRAGGDRDDVVTEHVDGNLEKEARVDPTREGHQHAPHVAQGGAQRRELGGLVHVRCPRDGRDRW